MELTTQEIQEATGGRWLGARGGTTVRSISTDTRRIAAGDLFVALRGESFDAHRFLGRAVEGGACALVVDDAESARQLREEVPVLVVSDTLRALGDIAAAWRGRMPARRVAIVGSSGKTTTKDMLGCILSTEGPTLATEGNFNNLIGLPWTLFRLTPEHRWAVLELGMNEPDELGRLTRIADPDLLLLVNIGSAHIGKFGSRQKLIEAKSEAVRELREGVPVLYSADCPGCRDIVGRWAGERPVLSFAVDAAAEVCVRNVRPHPGLGYAFDLRVADRDIPTNLAAFGRYNVANAAAAAAAAHYLGIGLARIVEGLGRFRPGALRSEVRSVGGVTLIVDCYNANPESMHAALQSLEEWTEPDARTFAVLGEMLELGPQADTCHAQVARRLARMKLYRVFLTGEAMRDLAGRWEGAAGVMVHFDDNAELGRRLCEEVRAGDRVFFKGSRGNKLEEAVALLESGLREGAAARQGDGG